MDFNLKYCSSCKCRFRLFKIGGIEYDFSDKLYGEISDSDVVDLFLEHRLPETIYKDLNERLGKSDYLAGKNYTIADIATWP